MEVSFQHLTGSRQGQLEKLQGDRITVGRNPNNILKFDPYVDLDVSGEHAQLTVGDDGKLLLTDLNSTNGTFMNGQQVKGPPVLCEPGSKVKFGKNGPEVKIDYIPGPRKQDEQTKQQLAKVQQDLEQQKAQAAKSKKKTIIIACVAGVVLLGGGIGYGVYSSGAAKEKKAADAVAAVVEPRQDAQDKRASKLAGPIWDQAEADEEQALALQEQGEYEQAAEAAEQARQGYRAAAKLADVLALAHDRREEAVNKFLADQYAKEDLAKGNGYLKQADAAMKKGEVDKVKGFADKAARAFKVAGDNAYFQGVQVAGKAAAEKARADARKRLDEELKRINEQRAKLAKAASEAEAQRQAQLDKLKRQMEGATAAKLAELQAEIHKVATKRPDNMRVLDTINVAKKKVALIQTDLYVEADGKQADLGVTRFGTGFLYKKGHLVTAKVVLRPDLFEPAVRGQADLLKQQGRVVKQRYTVWVYNPKKAKFQAIFTSKKGNVELGVSSPDKMLKDKVTAEVDFSANKISVEVQVHDPKRGNLATLKLKGRLPKGLVSAGREGEMQELVVGVGTVLEKGVPGSAPVKGNIARQQGGLFEIPTTYEAPRSVVGSPVLDLEAKTLGVIVWVGKSSVLFAPLSAIDALIGL